MTLDREVLHDLEARVGNHLLSLLDRLTNHLGQLDHLGIFISIKFIVFDVTKFLERVGLLLVYLIEILDLRRHSVVDIEHLLDELLILTSLHLFIELLLSLK